jgi:uncharacterized protein YndB with AHSA1/START domain
VWHALTNPHALASWFWPPSLGADVRIDPRPGGALRIAATAGTEMAVSGEFTQADAPRRIAFTWRWDGEEAVTQVDIELSPVEDGTALVLVHTGFTTRADRDNHFIGWSDCLDRLDTGIASAAARRH